VKPFKEPKLSGPCVVHRPPKDDLKIEKPKVDINTAPKKLT